MLGRFENIWTKDKSYFQITPSGMNGIKYTLGFKVLDDNGYFIIRGNLDDKKTLYELKSHILERMNLAARHDITHLLYGKKVINESDAFKRLFIRYFSINNLELLVKNNLKISIEKLFLSYGESLPLYKDDNGGYINLGEKITDIADTIYYINGYTQDGLENYHYFPVNVEVSLKLNRKYKKKLYEEEINE